MNLNEILGDSRATLRTFRTVHLVSTRGRPRKEVDPARLQRLLDARIKVSDIGTMFAVTARTVWRWIKRYNLNVKKFTTIQDVQLDGHVADILAFRHDGGKDLINYTAYQLLIRI